MRIVVLALTVLITQGCASFTHYPVQYDSAPQAAKVYCDGEFKGWTPTIVLIDKDRIQTNGKLDVGMCYAEWESGFKQNFFTIIDTNEDPKGKVFTVYRPQSQIGILLDLEAVNENEERREARREAFIKAYEEAKANSPCNTLNPNVACVLPIEPE
uniref:hypothetical protein n=1 Tax=Thaumasiovibrio occultus TaxID=1891184 RepID=UPI000B3563D3|nr:hypothetical protein [Thaumasiovibrio occultus]